MRDVVKWRELMRSRPKPARAVIERVTHYEGTVFVDPATATISASVKVVMQTLGSGPGNAAFYLKLPVISVRDLDGNELTHTEDEASGYRYLNVELPDVSEELGLITIIVDLQGQPEFSINGHLNVNLCGGVVGLHRDSAGDPGPCAVMTAPIWRSVYSP